MAQAKTKAVFSAEPEHLRQIQEYVNSGRYRSASEFLREAIREKFVCLRRERLADQVAKYCAERSTKVDADLIEHQAFDDLNGK